MTEAAPLRFARKEYRRTIRKANCFVRNRKSRFSLNSSFIVHHSSLLMIAYIGRLRVRSWSEVTQRHQRFAAVVIELHSLPGGIVADEHLVLGQLAVADHDGRLQAVLSH